MIEWRMENDIVFLLKTMKSTYLKDTLTKGRFCFSFPETFSSANSDQLCSAQIDEWDSRHFFRAEKIYCYPIIEESPNGIKYGNGFPLAERAVLREISTISKRTPFCCFRKITKSDLISRKNAFTFSLGDTVDRIKTEFGHDSFIIICEPNVFIKRILKLQHCFGRSITYGELDYDSAKEFENAGFEQIKMFQKRIAYEWQKEYRIIIEPTPETTNQILDIGSIEDIAFGGDIENLRKGYIFANSAEDIEQLNTH